MSAPVPYTWQSNCLTAIELTAAGGGTDFLAAVTFSSGKTFLALLYAQRSLAAGRYDIVAVLAPSTEIESYWISEAAKFGLTFATLSTATEDAHGLVFTYQLLSGSGLKTLKELCETRRVLVIADEIHHGGMGRPWGDAVRRATQKAAFRLGLTGTAFRTDDAEIPILRYSGTVGVPHFEYSYGEALHDGVVAPVFFRWLNGSVTFDGETVSLDESATLSPDRCSKLLTAATSAGSQFSRELLAGAHSELMNCWATDKTVKGLVIDQDIETATTSYEFLTLTLKARAVLVVSSEPGAHARLEAFKTDDNLWCVSVGMVNEGVNITRLKVLAYLSNDKTELAFSQAKGRLTRLVEDRADQRVLMHLPKLAAFETFAAGIEKSRNHELGKSSGPGAPLRRFCAQCGEPSPASASRCEHCGHEFPKRATPRDGAVVMDSDGFPDGLTFNGQHFSETEIDTVIGLFCRDDADVAELRREGRVVWSGRHLDTLTWMAKRDAITLGEMFLSVAAKRKGDPFEVPADARYAGTLHG